MLVGGRLAVVLQRRPEERVEGFSFADGQLAERQTWNVLPPDAPKATCVPAGVALAPDGRTLCIAGDRGHEVLALDTESEEPPVRVKLPDASFPYACVIDETHSRAYVSLWGQAAVAVLDWPLRDGAAVAAVWPTGDHPNEMLLTRDAATLYVACANGNTVHVLDTATGRPREVIFSALYPDAPNGSTPNSIALSPDEKTLYVANADNNNLAVRDVSEPGRSVSKGFIPVGWYPTSVRVSPDGKLSARRQRQRRRLTRQSRRPESPAPPRGERRAHRRAAPRHVERDPRAR